MRQSRSANEELEKQSKAEAREAESESECRAKASRAEGRGGSLLAAHPSRQTRSARCQDEIVANVIHAVL